MVDYSRYKYLAVDVRGAIAFITINRPDRMNACNREDHAEFPRILRDLARDDELKVAVVTGAGRAFSVGADLDLLEYMNTHPDELTELSNEAREIVNAHIDLEKPIIAAINGYAMGAAAIFGLLCDFVIVERQAKIADGHVRAALAAGDGGALIWPLAVGLTKAKRYLLTGDWINAQEAERIGLVTEVVEEGESLKRAAEIAERLAAGPQTAIRYTKRALNQWLRLGATTAFDYSLALEMMTFLTDDMRNAARDLKAKGPGAIPPERAR